MKVVLGSTNPVKLNAVRTIMGRAFPDFSVEGVDLSSGVNEQPLSDEETLLGATNRARAALLHNGAAYGIGCEGGVHDTSYGMFLTNWAVIIDTTGKIGRGSSTRMLLPETIAHQLRAGRELGPIMDEYTKRTNTKHANGAIGIFTNDLVVRQEAFEHAVAYALAPFLHPDKY